MNTIEQLTAIKTWLEKQHYELTKESFGKRVSTAGINYESQLGDLIHLSELEIEAAHKEQIEKLTCFCPFCCNMIKPNFDAPSKEAK